MLEKKMFFRKNIIRDTPFLLGGSVQSESAVLFVCSYSYYFAFLSSVLLLFSPLYAYVRLSIQIHI